MPLGEVRQQLQTVCQSVQDVVQIPNDLLRQLMKSKSGQAEKEMMEMQNWFQYKFNFLKMHIKHKRLSKYSGFKSPAKWPSESVHNMTRCSTDKDSMEISMQSGTTI